MKKIFGVALIALLTSCNPPTEVTPSEEPQVERQLPSLESQIENRSWSCYASSEFPDGDGFKSISLSGDGTFSMLDSALSNPDVGLGRYELQNDQLVFNFDPRAEETNQTQREAWTFTISEVSSKEMIWGNDRVRCKLTKEFF